MASRPVYAALGCLQCRGRVLRAITSNMAPLRAQAFTSATVPPRRLHRSFSSLPPDASGEHSTEPSAKNPEPNLSAVAETPAGATAAKAEEVDTATESKDDNDAPWFLQVEPPTHAPTQHVSPLPELPASPPTILLPLMKYVYEEMGLDDLALLDLRTLDPPPALGPNLLMLFATARSERHLHVSSSRLVKWLRYTHQIESNADGLIGPGELKTKLRRMRRKAKLLGSSAMAPTGGDDGISTGWICINLGTLGARFEEAAHFDAEGNMSGFGAPITGSTIVVQVMTEARRAELDLERLWSQQLTRSDAQAQKITEGAKFHGRFGNLPPTPVRSSKGSAATPDQKRSFSTSTRRQLPAVSSAHTPSQATNLRPHNLVRSDITGVLQIDEVRRRVDKVRWECSTLSYDSSLELFHHIFQARPADERNAQAKADLASELIEAMYERGMPVMDPEVIITMIEAIAGSKSGGKTISDIQSNLELVLLRGTSAALSEDHTLRLLKVYSSQSNWDQFWETWRNRARFGHHRGPALYSNMFLLVTQTGDRIKCMEALRNCVPEMLVETPPVVPKGTVFETVKKCILVADPNVNNVVENMASRTVTSRMAKKPGSVEFARMLRELEALQTAI